MIKPDCKLVNNYMQKFIYGCTKCTAFWNNLWPFYKLNFNFVILKVEFLIYIYRFLPSSFTRNKNFGLSIPLFNIGEDVRMTSPFSHVRMTKGRLAIRPGFSGTVPVLQAYPVSHSVCLIVPVMDQRANFFINNWASS